MGFNDSLSRRNFVKLIGASSVISAGMLVGCGGGSDSDNDGKFKIGGIGPVTGAAAIYGNATKNGTQIAVDEVNAEKDGKVKLAFKNADDEHDAEKSVNAYKSLKDWGMQILVGTTTTAPCVAVTAQTNQDNMFQLTPSASSTDVIGGQADADGNVTTQRKKTVFQMCFTDPNQGTASAKYISKQKLGSKVGIIYNNSDAYSKGITVKFKAEAKELGLSVVTEQPFTDDSSSDFTVQLNKCKSAGADLIFLPIYYQPASLILSKANEMGYKPKFFGVDGMDGILTLEGFDTSLAEGVMLLTPFSADATDDLTKKFVSTYKEKYKDTPNQFAADAYDCVMVVKQAIEKSGVTPDMEVSEICDKLIATITSSDFTYDGLTGTGMTWSDTGEVSKEPKGMVIKDGAYVGMDN